MKTPRTRTRFKSVHRNLAVEQLEERTLLAVDQTGAFLRVAGRIDAPGEVDSIPLAINASDFTLRRGRVALGVTMHRSDTNGDSLDPGTITVISAVRRSKVKLLATRIDVSLADNTSLKIASLPAGAYTMRVQAEGATIGNYQVDMFLLGDVNGDFGVTQQDCSDVSALNGKRVGTPGYVADADLNRDGMIDKRDAKLCRNNLGVSTTLRPPNRAPRFAQPSSLSVFAGDRLEVPLQATDPDGDPVTVTFIQTGSLPTGMLDDTGKLTFTPAPTELGGYQFDLRASDGQLEARQTFTLNVVRDPTATTRISGVINLITTDSVTGQQRVVPFSNVQVEVGAAQGITASDGSFVLDLGNGNPVSDTLKVRAELVEPKGTYPFIAEKLPLLLGHDVFTGFNNVISRPITLPTLDLAHSVRIDPDLDILVTTPMIPGASVSVAKHTLMNQQGTQFTGNLSITEVPTNLTPAALPSNLIPSLVVTIQPGEMVFSQPAPMTFPNRDGWAPGTVMDLWSINPVTGQFDDVGDMQVSSNGQLIETISGGVKNSSWHFAARRPTAPINGETDPFNKDDLCNRCEFTEPGNSVVEMHSGAVIETHDLAPYQSLGVNRGLTLRYDSLRADPRPIIHFGYDNAVADANSRLTAKVWVSRGAFGRLVPGVAPGEFGLSGGENFWKIQNSGTVRAAVQADLRSAPTGLYEYSVSSGILRLTNGRFSGATTTSNGKTVVVNSINSQFGSGWGLAGLQQVVENRDGSVLLVDGDGSELLFTGPPGEFAFVSPPGDFSRFGKVNGTYQRRMKDGTDYFFNAENRLALVRDPNGNETRYAYDANGLLRSVTDPVGLITTFTSVGGRITGITDPAGRSTQLVYDAAGNLQQVTDPDGSHRIWSYDDNHHMTGETDQRGNSESTTYDFSGRAKQVTRKDNTVVNFTPVQVQGLFPANATIDPATAPAAQLLPTAEARYIDGNNRTIRTVLDRAGQSVSAKDDIGNLLSVVRNAKNLVTRSTDARGNPTVYQYDDRGNVVQISDLVTESNRIDHEGREFWIAFPTNITPTQLKLFITGSILSSGVVEVPGINFTSNFNVTPGQITTVTLPDSAVVSLNDSVSTRGVHIQADAPIEVYGFNPARLAADGFLSFPVDALGTEYFVMSSANDPDDFGSHFAVVGTQDGTQVSVTPSVSTGTRAAGVPFSVTLNRGQTYYLVNNVNGSDLTGTRVSASAPVAVISGSVCAEIPVNIDFCNHLVEQLPAVNRWGTQFVTVPLATRQNGDQFRFLASTDNTEVQVNGVSIGTLNRGQFLDRSLTSSSTVSATAPILVAQFSHSRNFDGVTGDPFMVLVPPVGQFAGSYTVSAPSGFAGFINVVAPSTGLATLRLDGTTIPAASFSAVGSSGFSSAQLTVTAGTHNLIGDVPFSIVVYGFARDDGYGYLGGQVFSSSQPRVFTYDSVFNRLTSMTDELGHWTLYQIDPTNGNLLSSTRVVGTVGGGDDVTTSFTYTSRGLVDTVTDPLGRITDYDYDTFGRVITVTSAKGTADQGVERFEYDQNTVAGRAGLVTAEIDENGNRTELLYDDMNRLIRVKQADPDGPAGPLASPITQYSFDAAGNRELVIDARGNRTRTVYDAMNRPVQVIEPDPDGGSGPAQSPVTNYQYDAQGNLRFVTDPLQHTTEYRYDARNRRTQIIDPDGGVTRFGYDLDNNLVSLTDPVGNVTQFGYDARDRMVSETDPLTKTTRYTFDGANNLVSKVDRNGRETRYAYDDLDRLTTETWLGPNGTPVNVIESGYDKAGNLMSARDAFSELGFTYDARNRVTRVDNAGTPGAPNVVVGYVYDPVGNVRVVADSLNGSPGASTGYAYDALNRFTTLTQVGAGLSDKRVDFLYNRLGQFDAITRYRDLAGTQTVITTTYGYDSMNRLTQLFHNDAPAHFVASYRLAYDPASRITQIQDVDGTTGYSYDNRDQLIVADHADPANPDESYSYDANGNRLSSHLHGSGYQTGLGNRLRSDGTYNYDYDNEGNLIRRTQRVNVQPTGAVREFFWDYRNRLTAVIDKASANSPETQRVEFTYDAFDRRISKEVDTQPSDGLDGAITHFVYDRDDVILDFLDTDGTIGLNAPALAERYLHGPAIDQVLAQDNGAGSIQWLLTDQLGTTADLVSNDGSLVSHIDNDSFGQPESIGNAVAPSRYLFTGREFDAETGMFYYRARYLDTSTGRFISHDPVPFTSGRVNPYRYAANDPINLRDPLGLDPYLVCRPLGGSLSVFGDHCFIVTGSVGPGTGDVHSFGQQNSGKLGRVNDCTRGFSEGTNATDSSAWAGAALDSNVSYIKIPATDSDVEEAIREFQADQDYAATGIGGANSNSAARAIADRAAGFGVHLPGPHSKPAESSSSEVNFQPNCGCPPG